MNNTQIFIITYMFIVSFLIIGITAWAFSIKKTATNENATQTNSKFTGFVIFMIFACIIFVIAIPVFLFNEFNWGTKYAEWKSGKKVSLFDINPSSITVTQASREKDLDQFGLDFF